MPCWWAMCQTFNVQIVELSTIDWKRVRSRMRCMRMLWDVLSYCPVSQNREEDWLLEGAMGWRLEESCIFWVSLARHQLLSRVLSMSIISSPTNHAHSHRPFDSRIPSGARASSWHDHHKHKTRDISRYIFSET